jgi:hypothetical protein
MNAPQEVNKAFTKDDIREEVRETRQALEDILGDLFRVQVIKSTLGGKESYCIEFFGSNAPVTKHNSPSLTTFWLHDLKGAYECTEKPRGFTFRKAKANDNLRLAGYNVVKSVLKQRDFFIELEKNASYNNRG